MPAARATEGLIARTIAACKREGLTIARVEVRPDGTVEVTTLDAAAVAGKAAPATAGGNTCDNRFGRLAS
jgi:hypothetical protein